MTFRDRGSSRSSWRLITWHLFALLAVILIPPLARWGVPTWSIDESYLPLILLLGVAYAAGAGVLLVLSPARRVRPVVVLSVAATSLLGLYATLLMFPGIPYGRSILLMGSGLIVLLLGAGSRPSALSVKGFWLPPALIGAAIALGPLVAEGEETSSRVARTGVEHLQAAQLTVRVDAYSNYLPPDKLRGGGLARWEDEYLLLRGRGDFYLLAWDDIDSLHVVPLGIQAPLNRGEFESDTVGGIESRRFRAADVLLLADEDSIGVFVSHHYWHPDRGCFVLRLSSLTVPKRGSSVEWTAAGGSAWRTVFETRPCLPIKRSGRQPFAGYQSGGRLLALGGDTILMTVGDHEFDGHHAPAALPQQEAADYGKTLLVDARTGTAEVFTLGHRNPQGLALSRDGVIWLTEHGPQGGDELNRLSSGQNYGWPYTTLGADYGGSPWPLSDPGGAAYVSPRYAWVPSIGVSAALFVEGTAFQEWRDDLVVGSLRARTLWRLELDEDRVVYAEPLDLGARIRDLVEGRDGSIVLWTDEEKILRLSPVRLKSEGALLFRRCSGCHALGDGSEHGLGPDLGGVYGRPVASARGFDYSPALDELGGTWNEERLDRFLSNPDSVAPGTSMLERVEDHEERRALIGYLKSKTEKR